VSVKLTFCTELPVVIRPAATSRIVAQAFLHTIHRDPEFMKHVEVICIDDAMGTAMGYVSRQGRTAILRNNQTTDSDS
jgi:hypothetical protein